MREDLSAWGKFFVTVLYYLCFRIPTEPFRRLFYVIPRAINCAVAHPESCKVLTGKEGKHYFSTDSGGTPWAEYKCERCGRIFRG